MKAKKILDFVLLVLYAVGTIGGIGYTIYCGAYPIALGVAATAVLAFPQAKQLAQELTA